MTIKQKNEKEAWDQTLELMGEHHFELGPCWTESYLKEPEHLGFILSYYKTAAKMIGEKKSILELGCGEGLGGVILGEQATQYLGVDRKVEEINIARKNLPQEKLRFEVGSLEGEVYGMFDGVVALRAQEALVEMIVANLGENGIAVVGHALDKEFQKKLQEYFHHVFPFGMNDEVVCTGRADFVLYVACFKKG